VDLKDGILFTAGADGTLTFWNHIVLIFKN
jgi:hypothetical protein